MKSTKTPVRPPTTAIAIATNRSDAVDLRGGPPAWPGTGMSATQTIEAIVETYAGRQLSVDYVGKIKRGATRAMDAIATFLVIRGSSAGWLPYAMLTH